MEGLDVRAPARDFWQGKRVLITGHTGFKGAWLTLWLRELGAQICGFSKDVPTQPSLFEAWHLGESIRDVRDDLSNLTRVRSVLEEFRPEIIFHLAAQPLVLEAYRAPLATFQDNLQGTLHLLEALRIGEGACVFVNATTDKVYRNVEDRAEGFLESDALGGDDPYSASKACSEIVTRSYYHSFLAARGIAVVTCRAGNVIGGGDWGADRLVPDAVRAVLSKKPLEIRHPEFVRPWQHVIDCLRGYMLAAEMAAEKKGAFFASWNFGPPAEGLATVRKLIEQLSSQLATSLGAKLEWQGVGAPAQKEAATLRLDASLAARELQWQSHISFENSLKLTADGYRAAVESSAADWATSQIRQWGMHEMV